MTTATPGAALQPLTRRQVERLAQIAAALRMRYAEIDKLEAAIGEECERVRLRCGFTPGKESK